MKFIDYLTVAAGILGFSLCVAGIALFSVPCALIAAGAGLLAWSYVAARAASKG
jgi:hypothetical protein